jgi:hypothetical protein
MFQPPTVAIFREVFFEIYITYGLTTYTAYEHRTQHKCFYHILYTNIDFKLLLKTEYFIFVK